MMEYNLWNWNKFFISLVGECAPLSPALIHFYRTCKLWSKFYLSTHNHWLINCYLSNNIHIKPSDKVALIELKKKKRHWDCTKFFPVNMCCVCTLRKTRKEFLLNIMDVFFFDLCNSIVWLHNSSLFFLFFFTRYCKKELHSELQVKLMQ